MTLIAPAQMPLSTALKEQTATAHASAETSRFMSNLSGGQLNQMAVAELTVQYFHIYSALEAAVRRAAAHPAVARIADPRLERVNAIYTDLTTLLGADWQQHHHPLEATSRYVAELNALTANNGPEVIAHHYVRYLGDIAGGQALARIFRSEYGLGDDALNFYDFSAIGKIPPYRAQYKASLDAMQLSDAERARLIETAKHVFTLNEAVFRELTSRLD